jgi:hypothetical protein
MKTGKTFILIILVVALAIIAGILGFQLATTNNDLTVAKAELIRTQNRLVLTEAAGRVILESNGGTYWDPAARLLVTGSLGDMSHTNWGPFTYTLAPKGDGYQFSSPFFVFRGSGSEKGTWSGVDMYFVPGKSDDAYYYNETKK